MKNIVLFILISAIFFCSSCVVSFENPLAESQILPIDDRLIGKWQETVEKKALFEFSKNSDSQLMLSLLDENEKEKLLFTVFTTQLGGYNYLSLKPIDEDPEKTFLLVRYEINGDEMTAWLPDKSKFNDLLDEGKVRGSKKSYGEISVSNSRAEIIKFLESPESDQLFEFFAKLKKQ